MAGAFAAALSEHMSPVSASFGLVFIGSFSYERASPSSFVVVALSSTTAAKRKRAAGKGAGES